jgi:hypothetical protein
MEIGNRVKVQEHVPVYAGVTGVVVDVTTLEESNIEVQLDGEFTGSKRSIPFSDSELRIVE